MKINSSRFEDAIKVLKQDKKQYGKKGTIPITNDFEKGYVKGLEGAISILQEAQYMIREK